MKYILLFFTVWLTNTAIAQNLLDMQSWTIGTGSTGLFAQNGQTSENERIWGIGPYAERVVLWEAKPEGAGDDDGGFNHGYFAIDHTKMYRFAIWLKKTNSHTGNTYLGTNNVKHLDGSVNANPYFWEGDLPELNKWYLVVAYVHGSGDATTTSYGAIYDGVTGEKKVNIVDFKFDVGAVNTNIRSYLYYTTNTNDRQYFYAPRVEIVNGNEPSITNLLAISSTENLQSVTNRGHVTTKPTENAIVVQETSTGNNIQLYQQANTSYLVAGNATATPTQKLTIYTGGTEKMSIMPNGNIGIGITNPEYQLDVNGVIKTRSGLISSSSSATGGYLGLDNYDKIGISGAASSWRMYNMTQNYGNSLQFWAYDGLGCGTGLCANRFTIMDNGNVGIGITTPNEKLSVNGLIRAREIKVETLHWPDYVFEEGYKLDKLEDLANYIKLNKHLPEIPTAKEVAQNGIALGEMNKLLLKKVEELTLHLIEKDKEVKALKPMESKITQLEERLLLLENLMKNKK